MRRSSSPFPSRSSQSFSIPLMLMSLVATSVPSVLAPHAFAGGGASPARAAGPSGPPNVTASPGSSPAASPGSSPAASPSAADTPPAAASPSAAAMEPPQGALNYLLAHMSAADELARRRARGDSLLLQAGVFDPLTEPPPGFAAG